MAATKTLPDKKFARSPIPKPLQKSRVVAAECQRFQSLGEETSKTNLQIKNWSFHFVHLLAEPHVARMPSHQRAAWLLENICALPRYDQDDHQHNPGHHDIGSTNPLQVGET